MDLLGSIGSIVKRSFVKIGLTLKLLLDTAKSVFGVNLILYRLGISDTLDPTANILPKLQNIYVQHIMGMYNEM